MYLIKKTILLLIIVICCREVSHGQQLPQFTQYMYNTTSINPAYAGSKETIYTTILHRNQWSGFEGNPNTSTFSIHSPVRNKRIGLGVSYISDKLGNQGANYFYGDFAYRVPFNRKIKMSFGLKAGVTNFTLRSPDPLDPALTDVTNWSPNFGAGFYFGTNRWYGGISTPRILNTEFNKGELKGVERNSYYAIGGFVVNISDKVIFKPTALAKITDGAPASYDFSGNFLFNEKLWIGASFRFNDADNVAAYLDFAVTKNIRAGYSYDFPTSDIKPYASGTHEFILIYELSTRWKHTKIKSPRYF